MYLRFFVDYGKELSPRRGILLAYRPARSRLASTPCAPTRPAYGMSGFWTKQVMDSSVMRELLSLSFRIDPQSSVGNCCRTSCRVSARVDCLCTRHRLEKPAPVSPPGCTPSCTPQAWGTCTRRLKVCVAWFYAARAVFSGFRSWVRPSV